MTPVTSTNKRGSRQKKEEEEDLWSSLLSSLHTRSSRGNKHIVMLGTPKSGKSTLLAKMGNTDKTIQSNPGVEFSYLTVRDEERERLGLVGVHSTSYKHFLPQVITKERLPNTLVVINLPMDNPWNLDDELFYWTSLIDRHIMQLGIEEKEMSQLRQNVVNLFTSYKAPQHKEEEEEGEVMDNILDDTEEVVLPMPAEALTHNLAVPIIFVLNKADAMSTLQKDHDFTEEHFEFIQWHLRTICLSHGAGLLYCSPRENNNTKLLYDYISHMFYDVKFNVEAQVVDKDAIFVPIGWDSPAKIALVSDGFIQFTENKAYADQITPLPDIRKKRQLKGEDDQTFLTRMQAVLAEKSKEGSPVASHKVLEGAANSPTAPPPTDSVLSNFFNSLLTKKPGSGGPATSPSGGTSPAQARKSLLSEAKKEKLAASQSNPENGSDRLKLPELSRDKSPVGGGGRDKSPGGVRSSTLPRGIGTGSRDKSPAVRRSLAGSAAKRGIPSRTGK